jgi:hypothetical protein
LILVGWIRIRIPNADPDPRGQQCPTKIEISKEILCWMFFLRLKVSPVAWTSSWGFFGHQNLESGYALTLKNAGSG